MKLTPLLCIGAAAALLGACNDAEPAADAADSATPPVAQLTPAPVPTVAPDGTALEAGQWQISEDAAGAQAVFGPLDAAPLLTIRCNPAAYSVTMSLASDAGEAQAYRIDAGGEAARIDMIPGGVDGTPQLVAAVDQGLAIINALGEGNQAFSLTAPDGLTRQFPTHPGIRRVLDACR